jgi:hypothetical protein
VSLPGNAAAGARWAKGAAVKKKICPYHLSGDYDTESGAAGYWGHGVKRTGSLIAVTLAAAWPRRCRWPGPLPALPGSRW